MIVVCNKHYIDTPVKELGINNVNSNNRTDKAANNVIVECNKHYIDTPVKELGINNVNSNNQAYITIDDSSETIVKSQQFHHISGIGNV